MRRAGRRCARGRCRSSRRSWPGRTPGAHCSARSTYSASGMMSTNCQSGIAKYPDSAYAPERAAPMPAHDVQRRAGDVWCRVHHRDHRRRRPQQQRLDEVLEQPVRTPETDQAGRRRLPRRRFRPRPAGRSRLQPRSPTRNSRRRASSPWRSRRRRPSPCPRPWRRTTVGPRTPVHSRSISLRSLPRNARPHHGERAGHGHGAIAGLTRQPHGRGIDHAHVVVASDVVEQQRAGCVRVRDQHLGTGVEVLAVRLGGRSRDGSGWRRHTTCRRPSARRAPGPTCPCRHRE